MTITFSIIGSILLILLWGKISIYFKFKKQVAALFANAELISDKIYNINELIGLPEPVQKYFKYVLKDGQPYISSVRLEHNGLFKTDLKKDYINITGEQYFSVQPPQFIWKGANFMFTAIDSYIADMGNLKVSIMNIFTVVDGKGSTFDEGELQRWVAESVWFPTNLLPSEKIKWTAINATSAKLSFRYKEISFDYIVNFNALGEIVTMETQRFMTVTKRENWVCRMSNYKEIDTIKIPFSAEAIWKLQTGDYSYAKFDVQKIEYNRNNS
jgi:hypothetical protein